MHEQSRDLHIQFYHYWAILINEQNTAKHNPLCDMLMIFSCNTKALRLGRLCKQVQSRLVYYGLYTTTHHTVLTHSVHNSVYLLCQLYYSKHQK